jgi:hypothetical protein
MNEGETMRRLWSWVPVLAAVTGVVLVTSGQAGTAWAAGHPASRSGGGVTTRAARQTVTNHVLSAAVISVSCLTASRCVAVGSQMPTPVPGHGVVVTLTHGHQSHAVVLRRSSVIDSVSCRKSGCWAIGHLVHGTAAYLVKISSAGRPVAEQTVRGRAWTSLGPISCASMRSCEIAGVDNGVRPAAIEIGTWNGVKLRLHRVTVKGSTRVSMTAISCWHSNCDVVGRAKVGPGILDWNGLILTVAGGKPGRLNADSGDPFADSVSCVSARTCYGTDGGANVVTVTRGVVTHNQAGTGPDLNTIECTGSDCEVGGWVYPGGSASDGSLQSLSDETWGAPIEDSYTSGFTSIAVRGGSGGFIAIGQNGTSQFGQSVAAVG